MGTLDHTGHDAARLSGALARIDRLATHILLVSDQVQGDSDIAALPLARTARALWVRSQTSLILADGGHLPPTLVSSIIARDPALVQPSLRRLALSTVVAAERRLHHLPARPCNLSQTPLPPPPMSRQTGGAA